MLPVVPPVPSCSVPAEIVVPPEWPLSACSVSVPAPPLVGVSLPPMALVTPRLTRRGVDASAARAQRDGARRVEAGGRGQRAASQRQRARRDAQVLVPRDLQRAAVDGRAAGVGVGPDSTSAPRSVLTSLTVPSSTAEMAAV